MQLCRLTFAALANPPPSSSETPIHLCMQSLHCLLWRVSEPIAPKKTPLYEEHVRLGARMVPFGGWLMPVQYTSIVEEHQAVRNNIGIFDISHMGQLIVREEARTNGSMPCSQITSTSSILARVNTPFC